MTPAKINVTHFPLGLFVFAFMIFQAQDDGFWIKTWVFLDEAVTFFFLNLKIVSSLEY